MSAQDKLKILDLNLWLMVEAITPDIEERLESFVGAVRDLDPDVIALQEVWAVDYIDFLGAGLPGYRVYYPRDNVLDLANEETQSSAPEQLRRLLPKAVMNSSGLVTLSKFQATRTEFYPFEKKTVSNTSEEFATKGVFVISCDVSGRQVAIANTHLFNWNSGDEIEITTSQFKGLFDFGRQADLRILTGDFNLSARRVKAYIPRDFMFDGCEEPTVSQDNSYHKAAFHNSLFALHDDVRFKEDKNDIKVDHFFVSLKGKAAKIDVEVIKKPVVSDHFPVVATVSF